MGVQTNQNQRDGQGGNKEKAHPNQRNNQRNNNQQQRERRDSGRNDGQENKGGYRVSIATNFRVQTFNQILFCF